MNTPREGRGTRSRNSSPYVGAPSNAANSSRNSNSERPERPRTLLDKWIEPPLPAPRPSFADAGIERHGVVQNMAPLGTRPTAKQMKAVTARLESEVFGKGSVRRAAASTVTTPGESTMTPEPTAPPTNLQEEAQRETPEVQTAIKAQEEVASPIQSVSRSSVPPSLPPTQANGQGVFALSQSPASTAPMAPMASMHTPLSNHTSQAAGSYFASSTPNMTPTHTFIPAQTPFYAPPNQPHQSPYPVQTPTPSSLTPLVVPPLPMDEDGKPSINLELTDKIVEAAVQEALDRFKWPTAYALRTLYDDHRKNIRIVRLIEAVYNGRASDRDYQEFNIIMRKKKREGKANRTGEYYFNGDGSDLAPAPTPAPAPAPAPVPHISNLIQAVQPPARPYQTPYSTLPARPSTANSAATDPQPARASSLARSSVPASPLNQPDQHVDKRLKSNNVLPSMELNGNAGANRTKMSQSPAPNGMIKTTPKKVRSNSDSSSSSLSSVDEQLLEETVISPPRLPSSRLGPGSIAARLGLLGGNAAQQRSFVSPYASANNFAALASAAEPGRNQPQPISSQANASPKPLSSTATASSLDIPSSTQNPSATNNNTTTNDDNLSPTPNNMAPAALLSQDSISSSNSPPPVVPAKFRKNKNHLNGPVSTVVQHPEVPSKKRSAREISNSQSREESFVRGSFQGAPAVQAPDSSDDADSISAQPPTKKSKQQKLKLNVRKSKTYQTRNAGNSVEEEPDSSPTALGFRPDLAPGSVNTSRAGTPQQFARPTRKGKPTGSGLRLKSSPVKKKGGTNAGLPKESGPRSPTGNGAVGNQEELENNDFCSGCGGNGDLVCCDGCIRSFHFKCVDPPLADGALPDEWFCNKCQVKFDDDRGWSFQRVKVFDQLQFWLAETNPHSFSLPKDVREYFTDVKTGPEGEYEVEQAPPPPKGKKSKNDDETNIDYFRKKDSKGNTVLCYHCNGSAQAPDRMIIPCSFCGLNWHLDCLPNPLAKEPNPLRQWRCPAHVDDLLATLPQFLGPAHRFRTIKGAPVEIPAIARGFKNSGHIQIVNDEIEPEEEPGFFEAREFGKIYKLPEKGIVLDFISKVKQQGGGYVPSKFSARVERKSVLNDTAKAWKKTTDALNNKWNKSDLYEKQAALNLAAIATSTPEIASAGSIDNLVDTLISEASPAAISLIGRGDASELAGTGKLSKEGKAAMMAIKAAIDSRLEADLSEEVASVPTTSDPITTEPDDADTRMSTPDDAPQVPEIEL